MMEGPPIMRNYGLHCLWVTDNQPGQLTPAVETHHRQLTAGAQLNNHVNELQRRVTDAAVCRQSVHDQDPEVFRKAVHLV